ncbi:hypothetical protein KW843_16090 [Acidovorax sp. sif1233]|jgi:hypothetical protein|nr:hypothetical protein [Acidovorax sp. sif0732]MBV7449533.1 hypothetical protein [Acidovorax sp. sif0715]MBV7456001.1 hypothetical protein [Acidovorax sp. sif1233]
MICATFLCIAAMSSPAQAEDVWFTLHGDRQEGEKNLIEVRPEPVGLDHRVVLDLRVSRDRTRTSFKGQKYRSYYARVVVHCPSRTAWYVWLTYYGLPAWKGDAVGREEYAEGKAPVLFKDVPGEPYKGMISAACKVRG